MTSIVRDPDIRSGDARVAGTRITVLDIKRRVIDQREDPHIVAGEYDISMPDLFRALAYYYDHRDEFEAQEREFEAAQARGERRVDDLVRRTKEFSEQAD